MQGYFGEKPLTRRNPSIQGKAEAKELCFFEKILLPIKNNWRLRGAH
jgi:hypothetical protein